MGSAVKRIQPGEMKWREAGRKSLVAARAISKGEIITPELLEIRRPSTGLHPRYYDVVIGRRVAVPIEEGALISWEQLSG
jgi:sialic acid synthase SpsE